MKPKPKNKLQIIKKKGGTPQNFVTIAALLHKNGGEMICENCCYSVYECEGWEWFLVDCKKGKQVTKDEEYGFINKGLEECGQYRKRRSKSV